MGAAPPSLAALEVAVGGRRRPLAGGQLVGVHGQAHRAPRLAPVEAGRREDLVEPLRLGLGLHPVGAGHHQGPHARCAPCRPRSTSAAARRSSMRPLVHEPMNTVSTGISRSGVPADQAHVVEGPVRRFPLAGGGEGVGVGHRPVDPGHLGRVGAPGDVGGQTSRRRGRPPCRRWRRRRWAASASRPAPPPSRRPWGRGRGPRGRRRSSRRGRSCRPGRPPRSTCCRRSSGPPWTDPGWPSPGTR